MASNQIKYSPTSQDWGESLLCFGIPKSQAEAVKTIDFVAWLKFEINKQFETNVLFALLPDIVCQMQYVPRLWNNGATNCACHPDRLQRPVISTVTDVLKPILTE